MKRDSLGFMGYTASEVSSACEDSWEAGFKAGMYCGVVAVFSVLVISVLLYWPFG